jgi:hypothetical protein
MLMANPHACRYAGAMSTEASALRLDLRRLALTYAKTTNLSYYESLGETDPVVLFRSGDDRHGNFIDATYRVIQDNPALRKRLDKRHTQAQALPQQFQGDARELDSSNSSDALLMNIFCHPEIGNSRVREVLGLDQWTAPAFGVRFRVAGETGPAVTELDMTFSTELAVEAKLTERKFQQASVELIMRYHALRDVFAVDSLPRCRKGFESYQLIRSVLAVHERGGRFIVLYDQRRPDLLKLWEAVAHAIRIPALRERCSALTWQEISAAVPEALQQFLVEKYGIA